MATVARITAQIDLKDNLSKPLDKAAASVDEYADKATADLKRVETAARKAFQEFGKSLGEVSQRAQMAGLMMTLGLTAPIALFGRQAVTSASNLTESLNKANVIFADSAGVVREFARTSADALGIARQEAYEYASSFGNILQASRLGESVSADMSVALTRLSADLASFNNADIAVAAEKLRAGLVGEVEPLRVWGVLLDEATVKARALAMGFREVNGQIEPAGKVQARYALILEATRKAQGDFARTANDVANMLRRVRAEATEAAAEFGEILLPYVRDAAVALKGLLVQFRELPDGMKRTVVVLALVAAAAGPVVMALGGIGMAVSGLIAGWGALAAVKAKAVAASAESGGALAMVRNVLMKLTGPIGIVAAAVTALYLLWRSNVAGIQQIAADLGASVSRTFADITESVRVAMDWIGPYIVGTWESVVQATQPVLEWYESYLSAYWTALANTLAGTFRFIGDFISASMAGWMAVFGAGWGDLTNTMRAALLRMRSLAVSVLTTIAQFVVDSFRAMTGWASRLPGFLGAGYDAMLEGAQAQVDALRQQGEAAGWLAGQYQALADEERALAALSRRPTLGPNLVGPIGRREPGVPRGFEPMSPVGPGSGGARIVAAAETEAERQRREIVEATLELQRELTVERMKAAGATARDVLAMQAYGKLYADIQTEYRRAHVDALAALETFRTEQEERSRAADEERSRLDAWAESRADLARSIAASTAAYAKEREQLHYTTEAERARWEVAHGGYRAAHPIAQALYVAEARLLDQAKRLKTVWDDWRAFWAQAAAQYGEWVRDQRAQANERYEEYVQRLTEEMLKLSGAQEEVLRADLTEQFRGMAAGARDGTAAAQAVQDRVSNVMRRVRELADMRERVEQIREVARTIEDVFRKSLDDLFENGFKGFFASVVGGFRDMARQIAAEFLRIQMMKALMWGVGQMFGAGAGASFAAAVKGKGRAVGGSTFAGEPYIVGERGPELFVPNVNGTVLPRRETPTLDTAPSGPNIVVNLQVPDYAAFRRSEAQLAAQVFARAARARAREGRS